MQVQDIMVQDVKVCYPHTNLATAAEIMWTNDCGALPVLDGAGKKVVGMITDRDISMAVGTRNRIPSEITVSEVKPQEAHTCVPEDDIHKALKTMQTKKVRRLPVIDSKGSIRGILCLNDIVLNAKKHNSLSYDEVVETLKAICEHRTARREATAGTGPANRQARTEVS